MADLIQLLDKLHLHDVHKEIRSVVGSQQVVDVINIKFLEESLPFGIFLLRIKVKIVRYSVNYL